MICTIIITIIDRRLVFFEKIFFFITVVEFKAKENKTVVIQCHSATETPKKKWMIKRKLRYKILKLQQKNDGVESTTHR